MEVEHAAGAESEHQIHMMPGSPLGWGHLPTVDVFNSLPGTSQTREAVLQKITRCSHPTHDSASSLVQNRKKAPPTSLSR
jgi:hypothetical protein